jgi:hypothetical protein
MGADSDNSQQGHADAVPRQLRVFINYRNDDAWAQALLLYDRLAARFGSESVFLDTRNLKPGMNWLEEIKSQRDSCGVLLDLPEVAQYVHITRGKPDLYRTLRQLLTVDAEPGRRCLECGQLAAVRRPD